MSYADFTFYSGVSFLGNKILSADFPRLALRASEVIDQITFNRASAIITADVEDDVILAIQKACCAIAEEIQTQESNGNVDGVTSEHVGNYSVSYGANAKAAMTNEEKLSKAARLYLAETGLLFRGFADGEYAHQC